MVNIETKVMGTVDIEDKIQIVLNQGLFGFENYHTFVLLESECQGFIWLQSIENKNLAFLTTDPFLFFADYELDIDDESLKDLNIKNPSDVHVLAIITLVSETPPSATINLQGPIIINKATKHAKQIVLADSRWFTKHALWTAKNEDSVC